MTFVKIGAPNRPVSCTRAEKCDDRLGWGHGWRCPRGEGKGVSPTEGMTYAAWAEMRAGCQKAVVIRHPIGRGVFGRPRPGRQVEERLTGSVGT